MSVQGLTLLTKSTDGDNSSSLNETASVVTATGASSNEPEALVPSDSTPSQQAAVSSTPQPQYQTGELDPRTMDCRLIGI